MFFSAKLNSLINFGRGHHEEHFCEYFEFGSVLQEILFKDISYLEHPVAPLFQCSQTICVILVESRHH